MPFIILLGNYVCRNLFLERDIEIIYFGRQFFWRNKSDTPLGCFRERQIISRQKWIWNGQMTMFNTWIWSLFHNIVGSTLSSYYRSDQIQQWCFKTVVDIRLNGMDNNSNSKEEGDLSKEVQELEEVIHWLQWFRIAFVSGRQCTMPMVRWQVHF